ncbi:serine hydrolase domain-containing protein [Streptomyces sp. NPDC093109]|uniref:serine hydrolase domain-containing protein n=1 Tax=Streptomyces sp. NPDC093109 TaxID=3154977 RepID=UPI00344B24B5
MPFNSPTPKATSSASAASTRKASRRRVTALAVLTLVAGLALPTAGAAALARHGGSTGGDGTHGQRETAAVQKVVDELVAGGARPAALASTRERDGRTGNYTAGYGDLATKSPVPVDGQVRIASNTKPFTSVVVLQLVGEGKIRLDEPIETYLPGLLRGKGIDGHDITVRQLLQHTSGLPEYLEQAGPDLLPLLKRYMEPRELLDLALTAEATSAPGTEWKYSNTNYIVAGLLVQKVTGRPLAEEMTHRVIDRIGLRHTYFPATGEMTIREEHPKGYVVTAPGETPYDFTELDPSWGWAAGGLVSTNSDVNRFYTALLDGRLLRPAQLRQMRTTVPADHIGEGARYGLGLAGRPLSCGGLYWGHGGDIPGYETRGGVTEKGRSVNIAVTALPTDPEEVKGLEKAVDTLLCR